MLTSTKENDNALLMGPSKSVDSDDSSSHSTSEGKTPKILNCWPPRWIVLWPRTGNCPAHHRSRGKNLPSSTARAPNISIAKYLKRIFKYTSCKLLCFVIDYIFFDRLIHRQPDSVVTSLNMHRFTVTSILVATKMLDDVYNPTLSL